MSSREVAYGNHAIPAGTDRLLPPLLALMLGVMLLGFVGFAPIGAVHNAAHDTRHSAAFPCH